MIKLSENRLREIIAEEIAEFADEFAPGIENLDDIERENQKLEADKNIAKINRQVDIISAEHELDERMNEISIPGMATGVISNIGGAIAGGIDKINRNSSFKDALLDTIKQRVIDYSLDKIGLKPGILRNLLRSFIEELSPAEAWAFWKEPDCEKFVDHSYDVLIDFAFDHFKDPISVFASRASAFGPLKKILSQSGGKDLFTDLLSGVGVEYLSKSVQNSPEFRGWFNDNILPGVCSLWREAWDNFNLAETTESLSKTLSKTYGLEDGDDEIGAPDFLSSLGI